MTTKVDGILSDPEPLLFARLLGPFEIREIDGDEIELPRKVRALFAYLMTRRGATVPRQTLLGLLWGDRPEEQARASLRQALSIIRSALGDAADSVFASTNESVTVHADGVSTDLDALEVLSFDNAPDEDNGFVHQESFEFLEGLMVSEAPFEDWLTAERERVRSRITECLKALAASAEKDSRLDMAATYTATLLRLEPTDEESHRSMMRLYLAKGRTDAALQQFDRCRAVLQDQLNVEPAAETVDLYRRAKSLRTGATSTKAEEPDTGPSEFRPFLLAFDEPSEASHLIRNTILSCGGRLLPENGEVSIAAFTDASAALGAGLDIRNQMRDFRGHDQIEEAFALHRAELSEPAEPHHPRDIAALDQILHHTPPGEIDVSARFFQAVRRNSPCFFEDLAGQAELGQDGIFRVGSPMHRQPFLAIYENNTPRQEKRPCSLAVAPIKYLGPDASGNEYLVEGLTEDLILGLSRTHRVQVSSRTTLVAIKTHDAVDIGEELGVGFVLFGSLRMVGSSVRLNFSLADTETGSIVWSERFQQEFSNLFDMLDEVVAKVVARIAGKIEQSEIESARIKPPENMTAYEYYLRGIWHHRMGGVTTEHSRKAVNWFRKAIEMDPSFHRPRAALCCSWSDLPDYDEERADRSVTRAYEADPTDPEANRILGWVKFTKGEYDLGIRHSDRSVELAPHDAYLLGRCAVMHIFNGDPSAGLEKLERAVELDPFVPVYIIEERLTAFYTMGDYEKVLSEARSLQHQTRRSRYYTAASLVALDRLDAARQIIRATLSDNPSLSLDYVVGQELFRDKEMLKLLLDRLSLAGIPGDPKIALAPRGR